MMGNAMNAFLQGIGAGADRYLQEKKANALREQQYEAGAPARRQAELKNTLLQSQVDDLEPNKAATMKKRQFEIISEVTKIAKESIGRQTQETYPEWYGELTSLDLPKNLVPPPEQVSTWKPEQFNQFKAAFGGVRKQTPEEIMRDKKEIIDYTASKKQSTANLEMTKGDALNKISKIMHSKATLERLPVGTIVSALLVKKDPELQKFLGQKIDPAMKADLMRAWDNELSYLEKFAGTPTVKPVATPTVKPVTTPTVKPNSYEAGGKTHTFTLGGGLTTN